MAGINGTSATGHCFVENGKYYYQDATGSKFQIHKGDYTAFQTHGYTPKRLVSNNITNCIVENGKYYFVDGNGNKYPAFKGDYTKFKTHGYLPQNVKINPNNVTSQLEQAQKQLNNLQQSITQSKVTGELHPALNGKGVTPANFSTTYGNLNHLYAQGPVGNVAGEFTTTYGSAEQLKNAAPTGNIAPTQPKGLTPEAKIALDNARRAEAGARFQGTSQQAMNELHGSKFTGHDLANDLRLQEKGVSILDKHGACEYKGQKYPSLAEFQKANPGVSIRQAELAKVTDPSQLSLVENQKVTNYRNAKQQQGLEGAKLDEQVNRYKEGLKHDRTKRFNKLKGQNNAKILAEAKVVAENTDDAVKGSKGFWGKLWKGVKNNKGKIGLAAAAVAVTATAIGLTQCSDDKKATSVDNKDNKDNKNDSTTVKKNDVPKQAAQGANGELKAGQPVFVDGQFHVVKKGECPWSIAADILQKQGKTDNASILKLTQKIMSNNQLKFENDEGLVIIHPNDTLDVRG